MKMTVIASVELSGSKSQLIESEISAAIRNIMGSYGLSSEVRVKYPAEWVVKFYRLADSDAPMYTYRYATYREAENRATDYYGRWHVTLTLPNGQVEVKATL